MSTEYVKVIMGRMRLLFPAAELLAVEPLSRVTSPPAGGMAGMITAAGQTVPAVSMDEDLQPVQSHDARRRVCAMLREDGATLGLICDEAGRIGTGGVQFHALPPCMRAGDAIISMVAAQDGSLFSVCKTADLLRALHRSARAAPRAEAAAGLKP